MAGNPLLAILVLLVVAVALVPLFKALGLGTVLGFLAAGIAVGPYGIRLISDTETIRSVSEFGVVIMLFLIGLEVHPLELWRLRHKVLGLGLAQLLATAALLGVLTYMLNHNKQTTNNNNQTQTKSSTAIAMQSAQQRSLLMTDTG